MPTHNSQPGILAALPTVGRSITCELLPGADARAGLARLARGFETAWGTLGIGAPLVAATGGQLPGLRAFPALTGPGIAVPCTQQALWLLLRGDNPGDLFSTAARLRPLLDGTFRVTDSMDTFVYAGGLDLTGYEDGTENPEGRAAVAAALVPDGDHLRGSSFAAVQRWQHDLDSFHARPKLEQDHTIGRERVSNDELDDAPESAHVKRAAQESFDPPAFMVRRSMPWATGGRQGLEFIAYGESLDRFERVLRHMVGLDDGIVDGLFSFSRPLTGGYYWCPPVKGKRLDLTLLLG